MKHSKTIKSNQVSEPEVEYVKEIRRKEVNRRPRKQSSQPKKTKNHIPTEPKLLTDDDPFMLGELFGIWKNRKITLDKIREKQWGKRG